MSKAERLREYQMVIMNNEEEIKEVQEQIRAVLLEWEQLRDKMGIPVVEGEQLQYQGWKIIRERDDNLDVQRNKLLKRSVQ